MFSSIFLRLTALLLSTNFILPVLPFSIDVTESDTGAFRFDFSSVRSDSSGLLKLARCSASPADFNELLLRGANWPEVRNPNTVGKTQNRTRSDVDVVIQRIMPMVLQSKFDLLPSRVKSESETGKMLRQLLKLGEFCPGGLVYVQPMEELQGIQECDQRLRFDETDLASTVDAWIDCVAEKHVATLSLRNLDSEGDTERAKWLIFHLTGVIATACFKTSEKLSLEAGCGKVWRCYDVVDSESESSFDSNPKAGKLSLNHYQRKLHAKIWQKYQFMLFPTLRGLPSDIQSVCPQLLIADEISGEYRVSDDWELPFFSFLGIVVSAVASVLVLLFTCVCGLPGCFWVGEMKYSGRMKRAKERLNEENDKDLTPTVDCDSTENLRHRNGIRRRGGVTIIGGSGN